MCLSSPEGDANYFSGLMKLKRSDGSDFFIIIDCFRICKRCQKLERIKQIECNHVPTNNHWLSEGKIRELKTLFKASPEDAIREFGGMVVSDYKPALCKDEIARCFSAQRVATILAPPYVFTACDPSGGGPSHMSIVSGYFDMAGRLVILGLDSEAVRDDREEYLLLHRHYLRLCSKPMYRGSKLIFIPENNLGLESAHLDSMVADIPEVKTFWETPKRAGVHKDNKATRGYQFMLTNALASGGIVFDRDLFTVTREKTPDAMLDMLQEQMLLYHWETKKAADSMGKDRFSLTGKVGNKQDDLLITLQMLPFWGRHIMNNREGIGG